MRQFLKLFVAIGIIAFAASIMAVSCGKTPDANNNNAANTNTNSGNNGGGDGGCTGICPTTNLVLEPLTPSPHYVKVGSNTVTIDPSHLAGNVLSDANDGARGHDDHSGNLDNVFKIKYPGATLALIFVNRSHVTKDTITMSVPPPPAIPLTSSYCSDSETSGNTLASSTGGSACLRNDPSRYVYTDSYLGTVFNNTNTSNRARGVLYCYKALAKTEASGLRQPVSDNLVFDNSNDVVCRIGQINSAGTAATAELDNAWVTDTNSTTEVEVYAIGINVSGKSISQFSSATGYGGTAFTSAHDNAAFKKLLENNPWGELKFKVKLVTSTAFAAP